MSDLLQRMGSAFDGMIQSAGSQLLNTLQIENGAKAPQYSTRQEWLKAINAYKAKNGTTVGFEAGTSYTDSSGQVWDYSAGSKGGPGGMRRAESTQRYTDKRNTNVANSRIPQQVYTNAWGQNLGTQLYNTALEKLKIIKDSIGKYPGMDVDHIDSAADGGLEHPNNFRLQNSTDNRAEQNRKTTPEQKNALMLSPDKTNQVLLQGPKPTPRQRQQIMAGSSKGGKKKQKLTPPPPPPRVRRGTALSGHWQGINENHPLGGSVIDTDPLGILNAPPIRIP